MPLQHIALHEIEKFAIGGHGRRPPVVSDDCVLVAFCKVGKCKFKVSLSIMVAKSVVMEV
jgi:hypothetical protein